MKIRQAPVADLMKYIEEQYERKDKCSYKDIFDIINKYYVSITNFTSILPYKNTLIEDWCGLNFSNTIDNCPNTPGIIIYKTLPNGSKHYGLLYHSGYIVPKEFQTNCLAYFDLDSNGHLTSHTYLMDEWDGWCAPVRYFSYAPENYVDTHTLNLGERAFTIGDAGHDVIIFQKLLLKMYPEITVNGIVDTATFNAIQELQKICNCKQIKYFNAKSPDGNKIMRFLLNEN